MKVVNIFCVRFCELILMISLLFFTDASITHRKSQTPFPSAVNSQTGTGFYYVVLSPLSNIIQPGSQYLKETKLLYCHKFKYSLWIIMHDSRSMLLVCSLNLQINEMSNMYTPVDHMLDMETIKAAELQKQHVEYRCRFRFTQITASFKPL